MKKVLIKTMVAALALTAAVPGVAQADRWTKIRPAQCKAAFAAVAAGQPLPNPELLRIDNNAMVGDTLKVHVEDQSLMPAVDGAIRAWSDASGGAIKIVKVDAPAAGVVSIRKQQTTAQGEMIWSPTPHLIVDPAKNSRLNLENQIFIMSHELGHAMGLSHGCANTVMLNVGSGTASLTPTAVDAAAVRQGRF